MKTGIKTRLIKAGRVIIVRRTPNGVEALRNSSNGKIWTFRNNTKAEKFLESNHLASDQFEFYCAQKDIPYTYGKEKNG